MEKDLKVALKITAEDKTGPALSKTKAGIQSVSKQLTSMQNQFYAFFSVMKTFQGAKALAGLTEQIQLANTCLEVAVKNMRASAAVQNELYTLARQTGGGYVALSQLYSRMAVQADAYNISQEKMLTLTRATARSLQISGAGATEAAAATLQLSQALGSGELRGDEFRSLAENAPRLMQALADGLDVPIGRLRDLAFEGKLTTKVVVEALESQAKVLEQEASRIPRTIGMASAAARDELGRVMVEWNKTSNFTKKLASLMDFLGTHMNGAFHAGLATVITGISVAIGRAATPVLGYVTALRTKIAASRQAAQSELTAAQAALELARAHAAGSVSARGSAIAQQQLAAAQQRVVAAQKAMSVSGAASSMTVSGLRGILSALGGPIGAITTAVSLGTMAWFAWGDAAQKAGKKAQDALEAARHDTERKQAASAYGTGSLSLQKEAIGEARKELAAAIEELQKRREKPSVAYSSMGVDRRVQMAEKRVDDARKRLAEATKLYEQAREARLGASTGTDPGDGGPRILQNALTDWVNKFSASQDKVQSILNEFQKRAKEAKLDPKSRTYTVLRGRLEDALLGKARSEFTEAVDQIISPMNELSRVLKEVREKGRAAKLPENTIKAAEDKIRATFNAKGLGKDVETALAGVRRQIRELTGTATAGDIRSKVSAPYKKLKADLQAQGRDKDILAVEKLIDIKAATAQMQELESRWQLTMTRMRNSQEQVKLQLEAGLIGDSEAREQMAALAEQSQTQLQGILQKMAPLAEITGPQGIENLRRLQNELERTSLVTDSLGASIKNSLQNSLANMFTQIATGAASGKEALVGMVQAFAAALAQIAANRLAAMLVGTLFGGFGGGAGGGTPTVSVSTGGHVRGRGTDTSDSIPAWLSNYEYVVRAAVVRQPGVLEFLQDLNRRGLIALRQWAGMAKHANGGLAGFSLPQMPIPKLPDSRSGAGNTTVKNAVNLHVYDDPQRIAHAAFATRAGEEAFVAMLGKNPARFRQLLEM